jgi:Ca2+/Na+ antiporter
MKTFAHAMTALHFVFALAFASAIYPFPIEIIGAVLIVTGIIAVITGGVWFQDEDSMRMPVFIIAGGMQMLLGALTFILAMSQNSVLIVSAFMLTILGYTWRSVSVNRRQKTSTP